VTALPTIDQLLFKGTHNSYSCRGEGDLDPPCMNHPPSKQLDEFGVWSLEIDFSVIEINGMPTPVVGHDYEGHATCYGADYPAWPGSFLLADFLRSIRNTVAFNYRPIFIYFDIKTGDGSWGIGDYHSKLGMGLEIARDIFTNDLLILEQYRHDHQGGYPTVLELAHKIVVFFPFPEFPDHRPEIPDPPAGTLVSTNSDKCTSKSVVERSIENGSPLEGGITVPGGYHVFRLDQYQADWTFEFGVPPNPLVVDASAQPPWTVTDSEGDEWACSIAGVGPSHDVWKGEVVHEHGTFRFPFRTFQGALARVEGTTANAVEDVRRAGYGWTVLVRPGSYDEQVTFRTPLMLVRDPGSDGIVVIGT
jgi:hypothetical protein